MYFSNNSNIFFIQNSCSSGLYRIFKKKCKCLEYIIHNKMALHEIKYAILKIFILLNCSDYQLMYKWIIPKNKRIHNRQNLLRSWAALRLYAARKQSSHMKKRFQTYVQINFIWVILNWFFQFQHFYYESHDFLHVLYVKSSCDVNVGNFKTVIILWHNFF